MGRFANFNGGGLRSSYRYQEDDLDPAASLSNLADCMLVLACGMMVALVVAWNIDITDVTEVETTEEAQEISNIESITGDLESGGSAYVDMGRVYQDPVTGKLYMIEEVGTADEDAGE